MFKKFMSELKVVIPNEDVLVPPVRVRTLSEDFYYSGCSPVSRASFLAFTKNGFPNKEDSYKETSYKETSYEENVSDTKCDYVECEQDESSIETFDINKIYIGGNEYERSIMAHYGLVSYDYHKKNNDVKQEPINDNDTLRTHLL
jgi:hypothetical protein